MNIDQVEDLILQALEHELGGVQVYETAIRCAESSQLKTEWQKYLEETKTHVQVLNELCGVLDLDPQTDKPSRAVVRVVGQALVEAMKLALAAGNSTAAELVACECVVLAETKDHLDWELIGKCAEHLTGPKAAALKAAYDRIEDQEDEHLYHTKGWCRELWLRSLGIPAVLPPPEERLHVKTAIGAAKAEQSAERSR